MDMKKAVVVALISILGAGQSMAGPYLRKPQDSFTANSVLVTGATSDASMAVTTITETGGATVLNGSSVTINGDLLTTLNGVTVANGNTTTLKETPDGKIELILNNFYLGQLDTNGSTRNGNVGSALFSFEDNGQDLLEISYFSIELTTNNGGIQATDTPDVGIGTVNTNSEPKKSLLSQITNGENILTGQTATDVNGTTFQAVNATLDFLRNTDAENTLYLNAVDKWVSSANGGKLYATGSVFIKRTPLLYP